MRKSRTRGERKPWGQKTFKFSRNPHLKTISASLPSPQTPEPERVRALFDGLASRYDLFNCLASLGLDQRWRNRLIRSLAELDLKSGFVLDIGTGTGDLVFDLLKSSPQSKPSVIGLDISLPMMREARLKIDKSALPVADKAHFVQASSAAIPLREGSVDAVISAFTMRNVRKFMPETLGEIRRVLKPGGKVFLLEMVAPQGGILRVLHRIYLKTVLPAVGELVFGRNWPRNYLSETIFSFWNPPEFADVLREFKFQDVRVQSLSGGIAVIHEGTK